MSNAASSSLAASTGSTKSGISLVASSTISGMSRLVFLKVPIYFRLVLTGYISAPGPSRGDLDRLSPQDLARMGPLIMAQCLDQNSVTSSPSLRHVY